MESGEDGAVWNGVLREWAQLANEAVIKLDAIEPHGHVSPEDAHKQADQILLSLVPADVRNAYERLVHRFEESEGWWFA